MLNLAPEIRDRPDRYAHVFADLARRGEGAFCPFLVLGDPDIETSEALLMAAIDGGADMLEVGLPFSDPVADGPVIQAASRRALAAGSSTRACLAMIARVRDRRPDLPIGLLTYANLVVNEGRDRFYAACADAGIDSALVADVPAFEAAPFARSANDHGVAPVLIAATNTPVRTLETIARLGAGYTYCVARAGVTGADDALRLDHADLFRRLQDMGAPPAMIGFGISAPDHVHAALAAGARGVICGSAVVRRIEGATRPDAVASIRALVESLKAATTP